MQYSKQQLAQDAALTNEDLIQINLCRRDHNRLGFAYQVGFVRLLNRFPQQEPFEINPELLTYISIQVELPASLIEAYQQRWQTIYEHQQRIMAYMNLRRFNERQIGELEDFIFEQACCLEQTVALHAKVRDFLRGQDILLPALSTLNRLIMEQRQHARDVIYSRITDSVADETIGALEKLLILEAGKRKSSLQKLKTNPRNASPEAMQSLLDKLKTIEATQVLRFDLSWLSGNYR